MSFLSAQLQWSAHYLIDYKIFIMHGNVDHDWLWAVSPCSCVLNWCLTQLLRNVLETGGQISNG